jgi:hypothetical protein
MELRYHHPVSRRAFSTPIHYRNSQKKLDRDMDSTKKSKWNFYKRTILQEGGKLNDRVINIQHMHM